jgi:hypothetical protein
LSINSNQFYWTLYFPTLMLHPHKI